MCIIAIKPVGKELIDDKTIEIMFDNNPDGAGFMYNADGYVQIKKGFMKLEDFKKAISEIPDPVNKTVIMHFRISTSGGINQEMTHPFPLADKDDSLRSTSIRTNVGIAHNGVLFNSPRKGFSDSADYIKYQLYPLMGQIRNWQNNDKFFDLIEYQTDGSRLAILTNGGRVFKTGEGWVENDGYSYSNSSFKDHKWKYTTKTTGKYSGYYGGWYDYDDYSDYGYSNPYSGYNSGIATTQTVDEYIPIDPQKYYVKDGEGMLYDAEDFMIDTMYGELYLHDSKDNTYLYAYDFALCSASSGVEVDPFEVVFAYEADMEAKKMINKSLVKVD